MNSENEEMVIDIARIIFWVAIIAVLFVVIYGN